MPDVYEAYKPLRNYLRATNLIGSLSALRWYVNYYQFLDPQSPPSDMEVNRIFYQRGMTILAPWQAATLVRELVINSTATSLTLPHDLRRWHDLASAVNKLKEIDEYISKNFLNQGNLMHALSKVVSHQQFVWQENRPNRQTMTRYYYIYRHARLRPIFEQYFGISVEAHFVLGTVAWMHYINYLSLDYPPSIVLPGVSLANTDYDLFLKSYSLPLEELKRRLNDPQERRMDSALFYYFDSLKRFPMILTRLNGKPSHICPVPTYLYWRVTDGIYYELVNENGFDQAIGSAFKDYCGEVLHAQPYSRAVKIIDADCYIDPNLPKPDWLIIDENAVAFVECKAKRMTLTARSDVNFNPATDEQLRKLAESVIQCYLALDNAKRKSYRELQAATKYFPVVVTMENWYVFGDVMGKLDQKVKELASQKGLDHQIISSNPYLVLAAQEFEAVSVLLRSVALADIVEPFLTDVKYHQWQFTSYLQDVFPEKIKNFQVFESSLLDIVIDRLKQ